jgi:hypothetical protein
VVRLHSAYTERLALHHLAAAADACADAGARAALRTMESTFGLSVVEADLGWFMAYTPLSGYQAHRIASHRIASHRIASHRIASHRIASHRIAYASRATRRAA